MSTINQLLLVLLGVCLIPTLAIGQFTLGDNGTAKQQEVQAAMEAVTKAKKTKDKAL